MKRQMKLPPMPPIDFEDAPYELDLGLGFRRFRVGTCEGVWRCTGTTYEILAVVNKHPGNGHFKHVLDWFERSAKRDKREVAFLEVLNERLAAHLEKKQGYKKVGANLLKKLKRENS